MTDKPPAVPVTVVIPVRNGADFIGECLRSVVESRPAEIVIVDGSSTDDTLTIVDEVLAEQAPEGLPPVDVLDDGGAGVAEARMMGVRQSSQDVVALVDADVVLGAGDLERWYDEFRGSTLVGLQVGLASESLEGGYWGRALAQHHIESLSKNWFGLSATMFERDILVTHGLDTRFSSGEDIELRHRLVRQGMTLGISTRTVVRHRFRDTWQEARHQWRDDGEGIARVVRKNGIRDSYVMAIPAAAAARGVALHGLRRPWMLPYWVCFLLFNYAAMARMLMSPSALGRRSSTPVLGGGELGLAANSGALTATRVLPMVVGFVSWTLAARFFEPASVGLAAAAVSAAALVSQVAVAGHGQALVQLLPREPLDGRRMVLLGGAVAALAGLLISWVLALLADNFTPQLQGIVADPASFWTFVLLGAGSAVAFYYDHVAVARRRSDLAMTRSLVQSGSLLTAVFLGWFAGDPGDGLAFLMAGATAGVLLSSAVGLGQESRRPRIDGTPSRGELRRLGVTGAPNFVVTLAHRAPMFSLPFLITELLSPATNAAWYVAWMMAMAAWFVPNSVGYSLQARLARPGLKAMEVRLEVVGALRSSATLAIIAVTAVAAVGPLLLWVMGPVYAEATVALWILCLAVLPTIVSEPWLAICRVNRAWARPIVTYAVAGAVVLAGALAVAPDGIDRVALLWLGTQCAVGIVAWLSLRGELRAPLAHRSGESDFAEVTR